MKTLCMNTKNIWISLIVIIIGVALSHINNNAIEFLSGMMVGLAVISLLVAIYGMINVSFKTNFDQHMNDERAKHIYGVSAQISWLLTICLLAILAIVMPNTTLLLLLITFMSISFALSVYILRYIS